MEYEVVSLYDMCMGRALVRFNGVKERIRVKGPLTLPLLEV